jgi:hypothetical protein
MSFSPTSKELNMTNMTAAQFAEHERNSIDRRFAEGELTGAQAQAMTEAVWAEYDRRKSIESGAELLAAMSPGDAICFDVDDESLSGLWEKNSYELFELRTGHRVMILSPDMLSAAVGGFQTVRNAHIDRAL